MTGLANRSPAGGDSPTSLSAVVRDFQWDDLPRVMALWQSAGPGIHLGPSDTPEAMRHMWERNPGLFLVAEARGDLVGAVIAGFDGRRAIVYHLAVAESFRRQGIGRRLMVELESRLRARGCSKSYLMATPDNDSAVAFYRQLGWEVMDLVMMGKEFR